jgi:uncharacterized OB-fold protein
MAFASGEINIRYQWPLGEAEEKFFGALKSEGVLTGARCKGCGRVMVPPRSFCEECFRHDVEYVQVASTGVVQTFAESYLSLDGKFMPEPFVVGIIRLDGTDGGLFHRIKPGGQPLKIGTRVRAVLAEEREGSILDIRYFESME